MAKRNIKQLVDDIHADKRLLVTKIECSETRTGDDKMEVSVFGLAKPPKAVAWLTLKPNHDIDMENEVGVFRGPYTKVTELISALNEIVKRVDQVETRWG